MRKSASAFSVVSRHSSSENNSPSQGHARAKKLIPISILAPLSSPYDSLLEEKEKSHFGAPLVESVRLSRSLNIPHVIFGCITWFEKHVPDRSPTLFQLKSRSPKVFQLRYLIEENKNPWASEINFGEQDVSSLLMIYLRELPHSLIPEEFQEEFLEMETSAQILSSRRNSDSITHFFNSLQTRAIAFNV
jgi:hypothetical protein